jgi:DNA topoisomerase I
MKQKSRSNAALRFGSDAEPGIRRIAGDPFRYVDERTRRPASRANIERARALVIPPAWTDVWIAPDAGSHVQATGRDARGRKQYRYHAEFTQQRSWDKFAGLFDFGRSLGALRRRVASDLESSSIDHDHVVAIVVRLLDLTALRVGNPAYVRDNGSYGLTTLRDRHARIDGSELTLRFRGKGGKQFNVTLHDRRLARLVRRCQDLPGQALFQYEAPGGGLRQVCSTDVNDYLSQHGSPSATAKTFRTWEASLIAAHSLVLMTRDEAAPRKSTTAAAIDSVAAHLGNTPTISRKSYVHPLVIDRYLAGTLLGEWEPPPPRTPKDLTSEERRLLRLLEQA